MKKTFLFSLFAVFAFSAMAQEYDKVTLYFQTKKYEDAKNDIDKLSNDSKAKDKAETYLWKAAIYGQLSADSLLSTKYPDAAQQSMDAFNTYLQKEPTLKLMKEGNTGLAINGISALYRNSINMGIKEFSDKDYKNAFTNLSRAADLGDFIIKGGFSNNKDGIDTLTILYAGHAAQNMGQTDSAMRYYRILADRKVGGKGFDEMYRVMLVDLANGNKSDDFKKYLAVAKELYPDQASLWSQIEMSNMSQNASVDQIMDKYNQEASTNLTEDQLINYAQSFANPQQLKTMDSAKQLQYQMTAADIYKRAFQQNPNQGIYAYNAGLLNYNIFLTLDDKFYALRGEGGSLKTQRAEVEKQQQVYADTAIMWLERGYEILKAKTNREKIDANSLNRSVDDLANLYAWKRDKTKGTTAATSSKDYDKFDAKFKQFDAEHDKYKM